MLKRVLLPLVILIAGAVSFVALVRSKPQPIPIEAAERAWPVAVVSITPGAMVPQLRLYGRIESPRTARLSAAIAADVAEVSVLDGETVDAGDPLVTLDDTEARLALRQAQAEVDEIEAQIANERQRFENDRGAIAHERTLLELTRQEVTRARELAESNVGSRAQLDAARQSAEHAALAVTTREFALGRHDTVIAQLRARGAGARSRRDRAALDVARTQIRAPFAGRVSSVSVSVGDRVRVADPLLSMYDSAAVEVRAQVPTRHLAVIGAALARGDPLEARATVDGVQIRARLDRLSAQVTRGAGGTEALLRVTSGGEGLALGRTVELLLSMPPVTSAYSIPVESLYGTNRVYVVEGERMAGVTIERLGERRDEGIARVIVRSAGLEPGARVILTHLPNAIDGLRVRVIE